MVTWFHPCWGFQWWHQTCWVFPPTAILKTRFLRLVRRIRTYLGDKLVQNLKFICEQLYVGYWICDMSYIWEFLIKAVINVIKLWSDLVRDNDVFTVSWRAFKKPNNILMKVYFYLRCLIFRLWTIIWLPEVDNLERVICLAYNVVTCT